MNLIEILTPDFTFTDERGVITQIVHDGYSQVNAVFTKKGAVRGNWHYHNNTKELFYIIKGKIKLFVKKDYEEEYQFSDGDMFVINEQVRHKFVYLDDTYLVGLYNKCIENEDGTKDIIPEEVI